MSYYGIRKLKTFKNEETGKWNFSCECYDSSIRNWKGNRIWEKIDAWFKEGLNTKEELEEYLFRNTLDGNFHGTSGKYSCIAWGNCKVKLSTTETNTLNELENKYYSFTSSEKYQEIINKLKENNIPYSEWENSSAEYRASLEEKEELYKTYKEYRYNTYYKNWKEYLKQQYKNKKEGISEDTYIIKLTFTKEGGYIYRNVFCGNYGAVKATFYTNSSKAKLFKKPINELKEMFCNNPKYSNIQAIKIPKDKIIGEGSRGRKYINLSNTELEKLETLQLN